MKINIFGFSGFRVFMKINTTRPLKLRKFGEISTHILYSARSVFTASLSVSVSWGKSRSVIYLHILYSARSDFTASLTAMYAYIQVAKQVRTMPVRGCAAMTQVDCAALILLGLGGRLPAADDADAGSLPPRPLETFAPPRPRPRFFAGDAASSTASCTSSFSFSPPASCGTPRSMSWAASPFSF